MCYMMRLIYASNHPMVEELWRGLTHIGVAARILVCSSFVGNTSSESSQPESHPPAASQPQKPWEPIRLCGTLPTTVVPAERYVEQLWAALDQTLLHSKCGVGFDTPVGQGGTLNMENCTIVGATAPVRQKVVPIPPGIPPPPEYLPEMKDEAIVKNTIRALSPGIVAVHGPTGTGKSTLFPLAITHWSEQVEGLKQGLTICPQPRRILAQRLCERVRSNRKMHYHDRTVGYMIARESSRDSSTKLLYCTEASIAFNALRSARKSKLSVPSPTPTNNGASSL